MYVCMYVCMHACIHVFARTNLLLYIWCVQVIGNRRCHHSELCVRWHRLLPQSLHGPQVQSDCRPVEKTENGVDSVPGTVLSAGTAHIILMHTYIHPYIHTHILY